MATAPISRQLKLTRDQLAVFLSDQQQIRQFELLFATLNEIANQNVTAGQVYAGPISGVSAPPVFRALVQSDIPSEALTKTDDTNVTLTLGGDPANALLAAVSLTLAWAGQLSVARGGTGQSSFTNGQLLIGNTTGNTLTKATLTQGANITITNTPGAITIAVSGLGTMAFENIGISGTAALAKITVLGADGSLTFVNGIITAYTAPT
tara:strand:- start:40 stop:663 length:624 start_codon:yes stop_codon:yes gene_type:complete